MNAVMTHNIKTCEAHAVAASNEARLRNVHSSDFLETGVNCGMETVSGYDSE